MGPFVLKQFNNVRWVLVVILCIASCIRLMSMENLTLTRLSWKVELFTLFVKIEWFSARVNEIRCNFRMKYWENKLILNLNFKIKSINFLTWYLQPKQWYTRLSELQFDCFRMEHLIFLKKKQLQILKWCIDVTNANFQVKVERVGDKSAIGIAKFSNDDHGQGHPPSLNMQQSLNKTLEQHKNY